MSIASKFRSVIRDFGVECTFVDEGSSATDTVTPQLKLQRGRSAELYDVRLLTEGHGAVEFVEGFSALPSHRYVFLAQKLDLPVMDACRGRGFNYVDLSGNAFLHFGDVYVDVHRRKQRSSAAVAEEIGAPINLFSVKRSQVIFALVTWPELLGLPLRYTSAAADVSMGMAFETIKLLREQGFVAGEALPYLVRKRELIDRWTEAYEMGLRNKLVLGRYRGELGLSDHVGFDEMALISGESAVPWLLRPTTLTVYMSRLQPDVIVANRWRSDGQHNIEVRRKFWRDPNEIIHEERGLDYSEVEKTVPPLLIYADLMASRDGRQREAAQSFRAERHELTDD